MSVLTRVVESRGSQLCQSCLWTRHLRRQVQDIYSSLLTCFNDYFWHFRRCLGLFHFSPVILKVLCVVKSIYIFWVKYSLCGDSCGCFRSPQIFCMISYTIRSSYSPVTQLPHLYFLPFLSLQIRSFSP